MSRALEGKLILVTGAAGTIGGALRQSIRAAGGAVFATDLVAGEGIDAAHDVTSEADWAGVIAEVERRAGKLDGLVCNAGIARLGSIETQSLPDFKAMMSVNVEGCFLGCQAAWPLLKKGQDPAIVMVSSAAGLVGAPNLAGYAASKGAVRLLSKSVALHGAKMSPAIRCNSVHPVFVEGAMAEDLVAAARDPARALRRLADDMPLQRLAKPDEISEAIVFLLSRAARFVTGTELVVDGGFTAR